MEKSQFVQRYVGLFFGVLMFGMSLSAVITGKVRGRFGESANRDEDGKKFWSSVVIYCLFGTVFVLLFLCKIYKSSK